MKKLFILLFNLFSFSLFSMIPLTKLNTPLSLKDLALGEFVRAIEMGELDWDNLNNITPHFKDLILNKYINNLLRASRNDRNAACIRIMKTSLPIDNEIKKELLKRLGEKGANLKYVIGFISWINVKYPEEELGEVFAHLFFDSTTPRGQINMLANAGAINEKIDAFGRTVLMKAAHLCKIDEMRSLIKLGADLNAKDHTGNTVLMWAVQNSADSITPVKLLIEVYKINKDITNDMGRNILFYSRLRPNRKIINYLMPMFPEKCDIDSPPRQRSEFVKIGYRLF